jgi:hypothetical protein
MGYLSEEMRSGMIFFNDFLYLGIASITSGLEAQGTAPLRGPLVGLRGGWRCKRGTKFSQYGSLILSIKQTGQKKGTGKFTGI